MTSSPAMKRAAVGVLALGAYLEVVEWANLYPWNDIRSGNGQATLDYAIAAIILVLFVVLWRGGRIAGVVATALMGLWGWLQIQTWWLPYFTGASPGWKKVYARWFSGTTQILPVWADHLPPDANHFALNLLLLLAFVLCAIATVGEFRRRGRTA
jgi:hypothetical protein